MTTLILAQNLNKSFGKIQAVRAVSFTVKQGEVLGFLGPNGAGKTTTMRLLAGYLTPDSGQIKINGLDFQENIIEAKKEIGYLPEGGPLYPDMRTKDLLLFVTQMRQLNSTLAKQRMEFVIEVLHLENILYQTIDTLSKGYKRRVALAQALLHDPKILILDEPTDGLDPNQKQEVQELIKGLTKEKAIIISTHILDEVESLCERAIIIDKGQILASGTIPELIIKASVNNNKIHTLTEAFRSITNSGKC